MKYHIVNEGKQLVLYKVANELIEDFESKYKEKVIASGMSIAEALLDFSQANYQQSNASLEARPVKYKSDT